MRKFIWLFLLLFFLTGCNRVQGFEEETEFVSDSEQTTEVAGEMTQPTSDEIYVYVCGKVRAPGVYKVRSDDRIYTALVMAGGVTEDGNAEALNQAEGMTDGQTIYVPGYEEESESRTEEDDGLVDLNRATQEELMSLPGIGQSKADSIVKYREENGDFQSIEDLMKMPGIKEGVFQKIKDYIKIT